MGGKKKKRKEIGKKQSGRGKNQKPTGHREKTKQSLMTEGLSGKYHKKKLD